MDQRPGNCKKGGIAVQEVSKQSLGEKYLPLSAAQLENPYPLYEQAMMGGMGL